MTVAERIVRPGFVPARARTEPAAVTPSSLVEYGARRWLVVGGVMMAALLQTVDLTRFRKPTKKKAAKKDGVSAHRTRRTR